MQKDVGIFPLPNCELFQVHGNKFKPHPIRYLGQACVSCVSHAMLFLGIRKAPFNGLLAHLVVSLVSLRIWEITRRRHLGWTPSLWRCSRTLPTSWQNTQSLTFPTPRRNGWTASTPSPSIRFCPRSLNCGA